MLRDDVPSARGDVFGVNDMLDALRAFCREQGAEMSLVRLMEPQNFQ